VDREAEAGRAGVPEHVARPLFQQLMVAVDYCHRLGIANRDVKVLRLQLSHA
jgi:serine/threonine-protein kinase SRK2